MVTHHIRTYTTDTVGIQASDSITAPHAHCETRSSKDMCQTTCLPYMQWAPCRNPYTSFVCNCFILIICSPHTEGFASSTAICVEQRTYKFQRLKAGNADARAVTPSNTSIEPRRRAGASASVQHKYEFESCRCMVSATRKERGVSTLGDMLFSSMRFRLPPRSRSRWPLGAAFTGPGISCLQSNLCMRYRDDASMFQALNKGMAVSWWQRLGHCLQPLCM